MSASVKYPEARWEVMLAVAALSDADYQQRVWIRHELPHENYYDSLDLAVHTLYDDWRILPRPVEAVGAILVDGSEVDRLLALGEVLEVLLADLSDRPDEDYTSDSRWPLVIERSGAALSAMVLAGPIERLER
jgi:hypothetical protein